MLSTRLRFLGAVLATSAATHVATWAMFGTAAAVPEAAREAARPAAAARGGDVPRLMLDEKDLRTSYANSYRIHTTAEEVVLDFGFNMPDPTPPAEGKPAEGTRLMFTVSSRTIMNYPNAKRLSHSMAELVKRYEEQFGEIDTKPKKAK